MTYKKTTLFVLLMISLFTQPSHISIGQSSKPDSQLLIPEVPKTRELIDSNYAKVKVLSEVLEDNIIQKKKIEEQSTKIHNNSVVIARQQKIIDSLEKLKEDHKIYRISKQKQNIPGEQEIILSPGDTIYTIDRPKGIKGWRIFDFLRKNP